MVGGTMKTTSSASPGNERSPGKGRWQDQGSFGVLHQATGKVFNTRFYSGRLEHSLTLLEEQSTPLQGQNEDTDDEFEDVYTQSATRLAPRTVNDRFCLSIS